MAKFLLLLASRIVGILKAYFSRVSADGGTTVSRDHAEEVYADTIGDEPTLIQSCDSGKAGTLYSIIPSQDLLLYQYTGAAAAYSLRSLSAGTINVVKVRRSGDNAELDFTATEVSDGTLASWVTAGGGTEDGFVTTWYDQSGNTNNATQTTAANQPKIVSSGTLVTDNGKAALDFDGTDDYLDTSNFASISTSGASAAMVFKPLISGIVRRIADHTDYLVQSESTVSQYNGSSIFKIGGTFVGGGVATDLSSVQQLMYTGHDSTNVFSYINGVIRGTNSLGGTVTIPSSNFRISSTTSPYSGNLQELILYPTDQSANRTGIEANINAHYNIYP